MTLFSCNVQGSPLMERMEQRFNLLLLLFVLLDYVKLFVLVAIKSIHKEVSWHVFSEMRWANWNSIYCHICAYPLSICDVDISVTLNKVFHYLLMASFHCDVQGSSLNKRWKVSNTIFLAENLQTYRLDRHVQTNNTMCWWWCTFCVTSFPWHTQILSQLWAIILYENQVRTRRLGPYGTCITFAWYTLDGTECMVIMRSTT